MGLAVAGTISRRRFAIAIGSALIGGLAIGVPAAGHAASFAAFDALIRNRASAARIGRRYLAMLPADTDRSRLLKTSPALDRAAQMVQHRPDVAAALLQQGINDDFRRGDTVVVDGWVLAATEARLCAVVALS